MEQIRVILNLRAESNRLFPSILNMPRTFNRGLRITCKGTIVKLRNTMIPYRSEEGQSLEAMMKKNSRSLTASNSLTR